MAQENDKSVQEKPSTYNKRGQQYVFVGILAILILVAISSFVRMNSGTKVLPEQDSRFASDRASAKQDMVKFEERYKQARDERLKGAELPEGESYEDIIARLRRELQEKKQTDTGNALAPAGESTWADEELERVRTSRYDDYELDLGFYERKKNISRGRTSPVAAPGSPLERALASVDSEIGRVSQMRERLLAQQNPLQPTDNNASGGEVGGFGFDQLRRVGQTASNSPGGQPLPGQLVLPLGTVIRTIIDQKVMSDYPGPLRLQVTHDVYDLSRKYVLIPAGSICTAKSILISNINAPIQSRMGYIVKDLQLPDGKIVDFSKQAGLDREGIAAVEGEVDRHLLAQFLGVAAYAIVANGTSYQGTGDEQSSFGGQVGEDARNQFSPLAQKYLNLVPTITLKPGDPVRIFIEEPVFIYPWASIRGNYVSAR